MNETDQWGSRVDCQTGHINALLTAAVPRSAHEVFDVLVLDFPTTTVGRVHQHFRWLRDNHCERLHRHQVGRRVSYRLA